jgi:hypothetical protein
MQLHLLIPAQLGYEFVDKMGLYDAGFSVIGRDGEIRRNMQR